MKQINLILIISLISCNLFARTFTVKRDTIVEGKKISLYGVYNNEGKLIIDINNSEIYCWYQHFVVKRNNREALFDNNGKVILDFKYDKIRFDGCEKYEYIPVLQNKKWGFVDWEGNLKIEPRYDSVSQMINNKIFVCEGNRQYFINEKGEQLDEDLSPDIKRDYDFNGNCKSFYADDAGGILVDFSIQKQGDKFGIKKNEDWKVNPIYDMIEETTRRFYLIKKGNKWGVMNNDYKTIFDCIFDYVEADEEYIKVMQNGKYGLVDCFGNKVIPIKYDGIIIN